MRNLTLFLCLTLLASGLMAQNGGYGASFASPSSFIDIQRTLPRPGDALKRKEDTLQKQFAEKKLEWPAKYLYIRSFKYDSELEIWVKNDLKDKFKLFKKYKVCALAGTLGPKRFEGDYQVPEGFYYINEFNPTSEYHLSLGINYPNNSDRILSDTYRPGGDIYIHGSCVTVGCIPLTDPMIEEVYILAAHAQNAGQDFIPVHIFPIRFNVKRSVDYLAKLTKNDETLRDFSLQLQDAFSYFEETKQLPVVMTDEKGRYFVANVKEKVAPAPKEERIALPHRVRKVTEMADVVHQWPVYPGGGQVMLDMLGKVGKKMGDQLPENVNRAFVQVEFIIDSDGMPVNFKVLRGIDPDFDDQLITQLEETMAKWKPAVLHNKTVAKLMKQNIEILRTE
ncbi:MAG: L,D-transpeptidase family protein [Chitinophagaceae bacterium]|nr:L,D-transpeptidase family protein [Chitinophagaceae bacterium]